MRFLTRALVFATLLLVARGATAQFAQYTAPGASGERGESLEGHIRQAADEARWTLGPLRLEPWATVKDLSYIDNVFANADGEEVSDVTATAGVGLKAYLRTGPKVIWAAHALPEYVWWADQTERRRWNGRYGLGLFAFFNRMSVVARLTQSELQDVVTAEFEQQITSERVRAHLTSEVELSTTFSAYLDAYSVDIENQTADLSDGRVPAFEQLNRQEQVIRAALRWRPRRNVTLGLGVENSEVEFEEQGLNRSNSGTAPFIEINWEGSKAYVNVGLAQRNLEPEADAVAEFPAFETLTGNLLVQVDLSDRLQGRFFGRNGLVYALSADYAYFTNEVFGAGLRVDIGRRISLQGFVEAGSFDYERISVDVPDRQDDVLTVGADLEFELRSSLRLSIGLHQTDYDSNLDSFDRSVTVLRTSLGIGAGSFPW